MKIIYVVVVLTQLWNGTWKEEHTTMQYEYLVECIKAANYLKDNTNPLTGNERIRPITLNINKYECRTKVTWK